MVPAYQIRPFVVEDRSWMRAAISDLQEFERALHDTRLPGPAIADAYLALLEGRIDTAQGMIALAVMEDGAKAGFVAACLQQDDWIAETPDSNFYGYVSDLYLAPSWRGRGLAQQLLQAAEDHLSRFPIARMRIAALANNDGAMNAYRRFGFSPYEMHFEKRVMPRS